jgi:hypothetical protein
MDALVTGGQTDAPDPHQMGGLGDPWSAPGLGRRSWPRPEVGDWYWGGSYFPTSSTVRRHFNGWNPGLKRAGLEPTTAQVRYRWEDAEIVEALKRWAARRGRPPTRSDWSRGTSERPGVTTVCNHFGNWSAALKAAELEVVE